MDPRTVACLAFSSRPVIDPMKKPMKTHINLAEEVAPGGTRPQSATSGTTGPLVLAFNCPDTVQHILATLHTALPAQVFFEADDPPLGRNAKTVSACHVRKPTGIINSPFLRAHALQDPQTRPETGHKPSDSMNLRQVRGEDTTQSRMPRPPEFIPHRCKAARAPSRRWTHPADL